MESLFGICPCCEEIHPVVLVALLQLDPRLQRMKDENPAVEHVMAKHIFGEHGSSCAAGSPFLLPPECLVDVP